MTDQDRDLLADIIVYDDGDSWVLVETGHPQDAVRVGVGDTLADAYLSLEATPIQSVGPDSGVSAALEWAEGAGWIDSVDDLEEDVDSTLYTDELEEEEDE